MKNTPSSLTEFIEKMKKEITLCNYESYSQISKYCKVRFLSLRNSISIIFTRWGCLFSYFHKKNCRKKRQVRLLEFFINSMNDPGFKFQIKFLYPQSNKILSKYMNLLYPIPNEEIEDINKLMLYLNNDKNFVDDQTFRINLCD